MDVSQQILSDIAIFNKYARFIPALSRRETYHEMVERNKKMHLKKYPHLEELLNDVYEFVYDKKVLPSMRSMQFAGKAIEVNNSRCYNCAYLPIDDYRAFQEVMFLLLGGTGVGYSVQKHHIEKLPPINKPKGIKIKFLIGDSIEGWADSIKVLMKSYFTGGQKTTFDFSDIRPKGAKLVTAGGKAPGPAPLRICLLKIEEILSHKNDGDKLSSLEIHDILCLIADAVLAGGIRRSAMISLFSADDEEMIACKYGNWSELYPHRARANNSVVFVRHKITKDFFKNFWEKIKASNSGEPGIFFTNEKDEGTNPCAEIALKPFQFCNLVEINASNLESQEDFEERCRAAATIGTFQASYTDFHYLRPIWRKTTEKEALLGVGMTGIASGPVLSLDQTKGAKVVLETNEKVAKLLGINVAARTTCVKPSGTTSLVLGCSSGIHSWHSIYYVRRMKIGKNEALYWYLQTNHPELLEDDFFRPNDTAHICVPQKAPNNAITREETALELLERVRKVSNEWIKAGHRKGSNRHNVSTTISLKDNEWDEVANWMWENRESYNAISVFPFSGGSYVQTPFEDITKEEFEKKFKHLTSIDLSRVIETEDDTNLQENLACVNGACQF